MPDPVPGVLVSPEEFARTFNPRDALALRARVVGSDARTVARVTRTVVGHDRTRAVGRQVVYVPAGARAVWRYYRLNHTSARYIAQIDAAYVAGDYERAERLTAAMEAERGRRWSRVTDVLKLGVQLVKVLPWLLLIAVFGLLGLGTLIAIAGGDASLVWEPFRWIVAGIAFAIWAYTLTAVFLPWAVLGGIVLALWAAGRRAGDVPEFLAPGNVVRAKADVIDEPRVIIAFRELGLTALRNHIKAHPEPARMLSQIRPAGCGIEVDVALPEGVSTEEVLGRRRKLAENLGRHVHEVFPSVAPAARTVRVWAADSGALDEPIGPSPMVFDETTRADFRRGKCPFGVNLRGEQVHMPLHQRHILVAGMSNQGKSKTGRALALWAALDPKVELWIADLKGMNDATGKSDWDMFRDIVPRGRFVCGPADEHVIATVELLEAAVEEMKRRLTEGGKWDPLVVIVDEVQAMYACPAKDAGGRPYGGSKSTSRGLNAVRSLENQGRVADTTIWQLTQDPSNQNFPVLARNGIHLRIATALSTESQARMVLQDKAVDGGAAPHQLRLGKDKGTVIVAGDGAPLADDEVAATIRAHYVDDEESVELAGRAIALRGPVKSYNPEETRDLLDDVHEAFGEDDKVRAAHLADRLRETFHHYRPYRALNGTGLVGLLAEVGVIVEPGQGRHFNVQAARVLRAIDERDGVYG